MQRDQTETIGKSIVEYGPLSRRVYLKKLHGEDFPALLERLDDLARSRGLTKIFAVADAAFEPGFADRGYQVEARVPNFFGGEREGLFLGKFFSSDRALIANAARLEKILQAARESAKSERNLQPADTGPLPVPIRLSPHHAGALSALYSSTFSFYPVPVFDPAFLAACMADGSRYAAVMDDGGPIAAGAAELDRQASNAEMTDFATLPEWRGRGLAGSILRSLETSLSEEGVSTAYTIARAESLPINRMFAANGYLFAGMLANNTCIGQGIETMNVWHKHLGTSQKALGGDGR
jgi:putative beta-lysine N-acetyltransferase